MLSQTMDATHGHTSKNLNNNFNNKYRITVKTTWYGYLIDCQHLTIALLDFLKLPQKIPISDQTKTPTQNLNPITNQTITTNPDIIIISHIPELGFGANLIRRPELHAVDLRMLIALRRESSPHNLVLVKLHTQTNEQTPLDQVKTQKKIKKTHFHPYVGTEKWGRGNENIRRS